MHNVAAIREPSWHKCGNEIVFPLFTILWCSLVIQGVTYAHKHTSYVILLLGTVLLMRVTQIRANRLTNQGEALLCL